MTRCVNPSLQDRDPEQYAADLIEQARDLMDRHRLTWSASMCDAMSADWRQAALVEEIAYELSQHGNEQAAWMAATRFVRRKVDFDRQMEGM